MTGPVKVNPTGSKTKYAEEPSPGARRETATFAGRLLEAFGNKRPREMVAPVIGQPMTGTELGLQIAAVLDGGGNFKGSRLRSFLDSPRRHGGALEVRWSPRRHEHTKEKKD